MPHIDIQNLSKYYGEVKAIHQLDLEIENGEILTFLGPSGCGKTTTLRCIAGLEKPDNGEIRLGEKLVTSIEKGIFVPTGKRNIGMVFQSYAIWPHMTVGENVSYPLRIRGVSRNESRDKIVDILELVRLKGLEDRVATKLSGGQQQRVALARALIYEPEVLLLDEPLSNLDAKLREAMRFEIRNLQRKLGITTIYVTHDQSEALAISDKICLLKDGEKIQVGTPEELYDCPACEFAADFIGKTNCLCGTVLQKLDEGLYRIGVNGMEITTRAHTSGYKLEMKNGDKINVILRPEYIRISETSTELPNTFKGEIAEATFLGEQTDYRVQTESHLIRVVSTKRVKENKVVYIHIDPEDCIVIPREVMSKLHNNS